jgi:hypothetical protein
MDEEAFEIEEQGCTSRKVGDLAIKREGKVQKNKPSKRSIDMISAESKTYDVGIHSSTIKIEDV